MSDPLPANIQPDALAPLAACHLVPALIATSAIRLVEQYGSGLMG